MKLAVLADNSTFTDEHFYGEPGLCYWIEADGKKILFDTGFSGVYLKNAKSLKINLSKTDCIVLSHGHNDHTTGLKTFPYPSKEVDLISHPDCLLPKYETNDFIGSPISKNEAEKKFNYIQSEKPHFISENIAFLGEIEIKHSFEKREAIGSIVKNRKKKADLLLDDSGLAIKTKKGVVVIAGCSHSGICNITEAAREVFKVKKVYSVIGGFHLRDKYKARLKQTVKILGKLVSGVVYPAHCSDFEAKCFLARYLKTEAVFVSKKINFG